MTTIDQQTDSPVTTFAKGIAPLLGGTYRAPSEGFDARDRAYIDLPDNITITVSMGHYGYKPGQATLTIRPLDVPHDVIASGAFSYDRAGKYHLADITVTTTRPLEALAKDIKRRLIDPSMPGIAARREVAQGDARRKDDLEAAVMAFNATYGLTKTSEESCRHHGKAWYLGPQGNSQLSDDRKAAAEANAKAYCTAWRDPRDSARVQWGGPAITLRETLLATYQPNGEA